jgi:anionic cell wall polymer biosynthesis LytR-Cps2A-Psr (LCP) family protein
VALVLVLVVLVSGGLAVGRTWSFLQQAANLGNPLEELQRSVDPHSGTLPWKLSHGQRVNILLLGYGGAENDAPWLTDTVMVMSIDARLRFRSHETWASRSTHSQTGSRRSTRSTRPTR